MEENYNLNKLSQEIYNNNKEKGFWDKERNVGEILMLITSELGEAMEAHRKGRFAPLEIIKNIKAGAISEENFFEKQVKDTHEDEIADALIRILDYCGGKNIDIDYFVKEKLNYNKTREKLHGKLY